MNEYQVYSCDAVRTSNSNGWLMKWHIRDKWLKSPGYIYYYMWDSYSEVIASAIARDLGIQRHLDYKLCILNIDGVRVIGCESKDYKYNNYTEITLQKMLDFGYISCIKRSGYNGYNRLIAEIKSRFNVDIRDYLEDTILLDSIILNTDRNPWNMSILVDRNMQGYECKIYDSGSSLGLAGYKEWEFWEEAMYSSGEVAEPFSMYYEEQLKYIRNNRIYKGELKETNKLLIFIENNLMNYNNKYNIQNTLNKNQLYYVRDLIIKRYNSVIKNKAWIC